MTRARPVPSSDLEPGIEGLAGSSPVPAFRFRTADFELRITVRKQRQPHRTEDELCKGATGRMTKYGCPPKRRIKDNEFEDCSLAISLSKSEPLEKHSELLFPRVRPLIA